MYFEYFLVGLINCSVNIESSQDNHNNVLNVSLSVIKFYFRLSCFHSLFQKIVKLYVLNFRCSLNKGNDNREFPYKKK